MIKKPKMTVADMPTLLAQWHPTKNGGLDPSQFTLGLKTKLWWLCPVKNCSKGCDHEWQSSICNRANGCGCPYCSKPTTKFCLCHSLQEQHPQLASEWHPTKNGNRDPSMVGFKSACKVWWLCPKKTCANGCNHEWETTIYSRSSGSGCPYCSDPPKAICPCNSLQQLNPQLASEWHPTKNGDRNPSQFSLHSNVYVWWLCTKQTCAKKCPHEWNGSINNRSSKKVGCPFCVSDRICVCYSLQELYPKLASEWHPTKNGILSPSEFTPNSGIKVWWLCPNKTCSGGCVHEWESIVSNRTKGRGCPYCSTPPKKICLCNSLQIQYPKLASEWHPTRNGKLTPSQFCCQSDVKVWWLCPMINCYKGCLHEWEAVIKCRVKSDGCPICRKSAARVCPCNSFKGKQPELAKQWHPTKNESLDPWTLPLKSTTKAWWVCPINPQHEWCARIYERTDNNNGCPICRLSHMETEMRSTLSNLPVSNLWDVSHYQHQYQLNSTRLKADYCVNLTIGTKTRQVIIELDGIQHFEPVKFFGGEEKWKKQVILDAKKDDWCRSHDVGLLRIDDTVHIKDYEFVVQDYFNTVATHSADLVLWKVGKRYHPGGLTIE